MMTVEITIQVPDTLGQQLKRFRDRLPEVLERGLREVMAERVAAFEDESAILALLASQPAPEQVLALHPTPELQERIMSLTPEGRVTVFIFQFNYPDRIAEREPLIQIGMYR
jgi:hypothetical protein